MAQQKQIATIIDVLSEGPIEGLKDGISSIYLDGTPILDLENKEVLGNVLGTATCSSPLNTLTFTADSGFDLSNLNYTDGDRYITAYAAIKHTNAYIPSSKHQKVVIFPDLTSAPFPESLVGEQITIGLGTNGTTVNALITEAGRTNGRALINKVILGPYGSGNPRTVYISETRKITNVSGSTITVDSAFSAAFTNSTTLIRSIGSSDTQDPSVAGVRELNYESAEVAFRTGTLSQAPLDPAFGGGQASFATKFNQEIKQTTFGQQGVTPYIDAQDATVHSALGSLGIVEPSNIDRIKLAIKFPSLIIYQQDGDEYGLGVEFQIYFEYRRGDTWYNHDGKLTSDTSAKPVHGVSHNQILARKPVDYDDADSTQKLVGKWSIGSSPGYNNNSGVIRKKSKTEFVTEFVINKLESYKPFSDFRLRIKRVTEVNVAAKNSSQAQSQSYLQGIFAYSNDNLNYSNSAIASVKVGSDDFDSIPQRSYLVQGMRIQVPTNYSPAKEAGGVAKYTRNISTGVVGSSEVAWDGKFRGDISDTTWRTAQNHPNYEPVYCNNPAWVYYDILINNRYGLGEYLKAQNIDKYTLYKVARYCDELVPDGKGGTEPRFSCNLYLMSRKEAYKVLTELTGMFRSILKWDSGNMSVTQDAPKSPIYNFTSANIIGGFAYESTSKRQRINQVGVTWNNPDKFYKQDIALVDDEEAIMEDGKIIKKDTIAIGCTSEGQALRLGKWMLLTERLETQLVKFKTGINGSYLRPGDLFYVQDFDKTGVSVSGRLAQSNAHTTTVAKLDRTITLEANDTYELHLLFEGGAAYLQQESAVINSVTYLRGDLITQAVLDGSLADVDTSTKAGNALDSAGNYIQLHWTDDIHIETRTVSTSAGNVSSLTVSSAFSTTPTAETVYTLVNTTDVNTAKGAVPYRVLGISQSDDLTIEVSGHQYLKDKYDAIDRGYPIEVPEFTPLPNFDNIAVPKPRNLSITIAPRTTGAEGSSSISTQVATLSWGPPTTGTDQETYPYVSFYEIRHPFTSNGEYVDEIVDRNTSHEFLSNVTLLEVTTVYVRTVNTLGRKSRWVSASFSSPASTTQPGSSVELTKFLNVSTGGSVGTSIAVNSSTGTVTLGGTNIVVSSPQGSIFVYTNSATVSLASGAPGGSYYLLYDSSAVAFKFLEIETDTTVVDPSTGSALNIQYWKENNVAAFADSVGTTNQAITIAEGSGAAATPVFTNTFTTTADYTASFSSGDLIKIGSGATAWYGTVQEITSTKIVTTREYINKAFSTTTALYKLNYSPDTSTDFIVAKVVNTGGTYTIDRHSSFSGTDGSDGSDGIQGVPGSAGSPGADGNDGINTAPVYAYKRATSAPTDKPSTTRTWTFSSGTFNDTDLGNSWTSTVPAGTNDLYFCVAIASSSSSTDNVVAADWSSAQLLASTGSDGDAGINTAVVYAYRRSSTTLGSTVKPSTTRTWTFSSGTFNNTDLGNSYTSLIPSGTDNLYVCTAIASGTGTTDNVVAADWSSPQLLASSGAAGASVNFVFARASTAPNTPTADGLNIPSQNIQWYDTPPSGTPRLWASKGTVGVGGTAYAWGAPYQVVGDAVAELKIYSNVIANKGSAPSVPSSGLSKFNFTTSTLSIEENNWNSAPGNLTNDGDTIYSVSALVSGSNTDTSVGITWSAPAVVYSAKTDGITGVSLNLTATPVSFSLDGTTYDPDSTSTISLSVFGGTDIAVSWSKNSGDTLDNLSISGAEFTFGQNKTLNQVNTSNTVTATVTGTTSDGQIGASLGTITVKIPTMIEGPTGATGASGLRTVQGYLYYEKSTTGAPAAPGASGDVTYTFSTGDLAGGSGTNEVLALTATSAINRWTNSPRTQSATSSNYFWTVRYTGTEDTAGSASFEVDDFSTVVQQTSFTGLVTFDGSTFSKDGTNITTIDGGNITTGTINASEITTGTLAAAQISTDLLRVGGDEITGGLVMNGGSVSVGKTSSASTTSGFWLGTDGGTGYDFNIGNGTNFLKWDGSASTLQVAGTLTVGSSQLTEDNTINQSTTSLVSDGVKPVSITGNKISIAGSSSAWDTQVYSRQGYSTAYVSFVPDQVNRNFMMGLDNDPTNSSSYQHINYKWYIYDDSSSVDSGNAQYRYNEGTETAPSSNVTSFTQGDVFTVSYDGSTVRWLLNGDVKYSRVVTSTTSLYLDSSFSSPGQSVSSVQLGPITSNNYDEVGGTKPPSGATVGATAGTDLFNAAGTVLSDIDVRNDQLVTDALGGVNFNPSMSLPADRNGTLGPAGYITNSVSTFPTYKTSARDIAVMSTSAVTFNGTALPVNPDTNYEISALVRTTGSNFNMAIRAEEYNSNLPEDKYYIGSGTHAGGMEERDDLKSFAPSEAITSTFSVVSGIYEPGASAKWFSPSLFNNSTSNGYEVEWLIVREMSTANGTTINGSGNITGDITMASGSIVAQTDANNSIKIDGVNKVITITDSGTVRVKLGKLS